MSVALPIKTRKLVGIFVVLAGLTGNLLSRPVIGSFLLMSPLPRAPPALPKSTLDWLVCTSGVGTGGLKAMNFSQCTYQLPDH